MSTVKRSVAPAGMCIDWVLNEAWIPAHLLSKAGARKKVFRATAGLTIDQQLQVASQLKAEGDDVLKNCSKELESMLLRMYNEASTARESKKLEPQDTPSKGGATLHSTRDILKIDEENNHDEEEGSIPTSASVMSTSTIYAAELEDLIRAEQLNRIALIKQVTSEREQLIYDAVIGRQMIEATLEEEVVSCEKDFDLCYRKVLEMLRGGSNAATESTDAHEQKIIKMLETTGGNQCSDEMLRIEVVEGFRGAFAVFRHDLGKYEKEFIDAASATDAAGRIDVATSKSGGWGDMDEERFLKVFRSYEKKHGAGKNPQLLYDQLALVLPTISPMDIKKHVRFHQHLRFYQEKRKDRQHELDRRLEELQNEAIMKFRTVFEQEQARICKLQQLTKMQEQCEERHELVSRWRVTKEAKERIEMQQREIEALMEAQQQQEEAIRWKRKHDQQKLAVDGYKKDKVLRRMAGEKLSIDEEQQRETERALQSVVNAERVQYRHHEFQPDPERTRQETVAFRANVEAAQEGLPLSVRSSTHRFYFPEALAFTYIRLEYLGNGALSKPWIRLRYALQKRKIQAWDCSSECWVEFQRVRAPSTSKRQGL
ncbi:hypothetical protein ON010_g3237 [Phytophthora cinnamomi]|nr:hypothetical protein ON010_g3237 [Phytophthora cinnamomi]